MAFSFPRLEAWRYGLSLALSLITAPAFAWGAQGHRLVGQLAEAELIPAARAEAARLLAGERDPTLAGVANWADQLRQLDAPRFRRTSRWHYVNFPEGQCDYLPERDCPGGNCVIAALQTQLGILADRGQSLAARRDALKFVVHFTGDIHQPLHAGNRPDAGGNGFQVSLRTDIPPEAHARKNYANGVMGTHLHAVWDYYILAERRLSTHDYTHLLRHRDGWPPQATITATPIAWAEESCRLIDAWGIYPGTHKMQRHYPDAMRPLAERRIQQAAHRLAQLLNKALAPR
ncbi:endonuclease [Lysobacter pythonis]|uniref:Endonuclease n=1 Tax=Solilutibacter pythonis TaxID=2483112 RepID=A0A3M2HVR3_9GAMM|nr:S1/P1 nuclease [Lysobacter pythonis]RMH91002.1 endonuclease [Lysobacter pythonis]